MDTGSQSTRRKLEGGRGPRGSCRQLSLCRSHGSVELASEGRDALKSSWDEPIPLHSLGKIPSDGLPVSGSLPKVEMAHSGSLAFTNTFEYTSYPGIVRMLPKLVGFMLMPQTSPSQKVFSRSPCLPAPWDRVCLN